MCVEMLIENGSLTVSEAERISETIVGDDFFLVSFYTPGIFFKKRFPVLSISDDIGGCACCFLSDRNDSVPSSWDLKLSLLPKISNTISRVTELMNRPFSFYITGYGNMPRRSVSILLPELIQLVMNNRIEKRVKYDVKLS
jgi:hypothetical protein